MKIESKQKGFTLIELMIVVAIIGILASIAIPQFASFRTKAFNASAISDLRGVRLAEEALFTDYQEYGNTQASGTATASAGALIISTTASPVVATATAAELMPISVSQNVFLVANDAGAFATMIAKHTSGDKTYGAETDQSGFYQKNTLVNVNVSAANAAAVGGTAAAGAAGVSATAALDLLVASGWTIL